MSVMTRAKGKSVNMQQGSGKSYNTIEVRAEGALGKCRDCGKQAETIVTVTGVPRNISMTGNLNVPYCNEHLGKSPFGKRVQN
jgi:hypothetical protein